MNAKRDQSAIAIHRDALPAVNLLGRHARPQDRGEVIFACDDGTVTERPAHVGDDACRQREQRRPGGVVILATRMAPCCIWLDSVSP